MFLNQFNLNIIKTVFRLKEFRLTEFQLNYVGKIPSALRLTH